jgi:hypothetical protein
MRQVQDTRLMVNGTYESGDPTPFLSSFSLGLSSSGQLLIPVNLFLPDMILYIPNFDVIEQDAFSHQYRQTNQVKKVLIKEFIIFFF